MEQALGKQQKLKGDLAGEKKLAFQTFGAEDKPSKLNIKAAAPSIQTSQND